MHADCLCCCIYACCLFFFNNIILSFSFTIIAIQPKVLSTCILHLKNWHKALTWYMISAICSIHIQLICSQPKFSRVLHLCLPCATTLFQKDVSRNFRNSCTFMFYRQLYNANIGLSEEHGPVAPFLLKTYMMISLRFTCFRVFIYELIPIEINLFHNFFTVQSSLSCSATCILTFVLLPLYHLHCDFCN